MVIRFNKFPYLFWLTRKSEAQMEDGKLFIARANKKFDITPMGKFNFLLIKYLPILVFIAIFYNRYDIGFSTSKIVSYIFAILLFFPLMFMDESVLRKYLSIAVLAVCVVVSYFVGDISITAFAIKYFIFIFVFFVFFTDLPYRAFSVRENGKVVSHFVILKSECEKLMPSIDTTKGKDDEKSL